MKRLAVCVALLIVVAVALLLLRQSPSNNRETESASSPEAGFGEGVDLEPGITEVPKDTQAHVLVPSLAPDAQQDVVVPIAAGSQAVTNHSHAKSEVSMTTPEYSETIPASDEERRRFVRIAFDRAKEVMEITDTRTATVEYRDSIVIVTFPFPRQEAGDRPPYPGPDYLARVKLDRGTGKVLEVLGAP